MNRFKISIFFILCALVTSGIAQENKLLTVVKVTKAWIAEAPPTATVLAGYMTLENVSNQKVVLTAVSSQDFEKVEIHETVIKEDKVSMVAHETLIIPVKETIILKPGGFHLMLIGAKRPLKVGDKAEIALKFQDDSVQLVDMAVKKRSAEAEHQHHH